MVGKTTPYILVGALQVLIVLTMAHFLFHIPFTGSALAFTAGVALFIIANLMLGYLISTIARTQMQAMQSAFFVFLPSILMSGFMFPFKAMPGWAQVIGEALPITHFLRIVREVVLKGAGVADILNDLGPLALITLVLAALALLRFRNTLD
jgi:ABC-2 type transport system permease protein